MNLRIKSGTRRMAESGAARGLSAVWPVTARRIAAALGLVALAACAAPPPPKAPPAWTSAIGHLTIEGQRQACTAVLVKPDVIVTVSHCLYPNGVRVPADLLVFTPSGEEITASYRGVAILGTGGAVKPGVISEEQAARDWALIQIEPDESVWPVPLAPLSPDEVREDLADGAQFYSAGYGSGAKTKLREHVNCGLLPADPTGATEGAQFFTTDCIVRLGDSGGPVALIEDGQPRLVGLIVGFAEHPKSREPIAVIVSAKAFAASLAPLVGSVDRQGPSYVLASYSEMSSPDLIRRSMDARVKPGHDEFNRDSSPTKMPLSHLAIAQR